MRRVVVTGTATEVGKTWVAARLAGVAPRRRVETCRARKPVQSFEPGAADHRRRRPGRGRRAGRRRASARPTAGTSCRSRPRSRREALGPAPHRSTISSASCACPDDGIAPRRGRRRPPLAARGRRRHRRSRRALERRPGPARRRRRARHHQRHRPGRRGLRGPSLVVFLNRYDDAYRRPRPQPGVAAGRRRGLLGGHERRRTSHRSCPDATEAG